MTYLVMECHPGYAVVLDQTGRFLKVANLNYQVGETVSFVIECTAEEEPVTIHSLRRRRILLSAASLAASGCAGNLAHLPDPIRSCPDSNQSGFEADRQPAGLCYFCRWPQ